MKGQQPSRQRDTGQVIATQSNPQNHSQNSHSIPTSNECLPGMDLFCDLQPEVIAAFQHHVGVRAYRKGKVLYLPKDSAEFLFLLESGRVQIYRLTPSGKRLQLAMIKPGTFFGETTLLGASVRNAYAEVVEDSVICSMSRGDITRLMCEYPYVALRMIEALSQRSAVCQQRLEEMAYRSVPARIAAVLLRLSQEQHAEVVSITHKELGDIIGASREAVTRVLNEFQQAGLAHLSRGRIALCDRDGLQIRLEASPDNASY